MTPTEVERELEVDVAVQWTSGYDTATRSFVNVIATPHGGTHLAASERALVRTMNEQLRAGRLLKNGEEPVTKEDVLEGMTAIVTVRLRSRSSRARPRKSSAPRRGVPGLRGPGRLGRAEGVLRSPRPDRQAADACPAGEGHLGRQDPGRGARAPREPAPQVGAGQFLVAAKLVDCRTTDDRSELFIVEGDSALGTA